MSRDREKNDRKIIIFMKPVDSIYSSSTLSFSFKCYKHQGRDSKRNTISYNLNNRYEDNTVVSKVENNKKQSVHS